MAQIKFYMEKKEKKFKQTKSNFSCLQNHLFVCKTLCVIGARLRWQHWKKTQCVRITNVRQDRLLSPLLTLFTKATIFPPILTSYFTTIVTVCRQVQHEHYAALWIHAFEIFWIFLYISLTTTHLFKNLLKIHHVRIWFAWDISLHSQTNRNVQIYVIKLRYV